MTKLSVMLCACTLMLAGCMSTGQTRVVHHYTLGNPVATSASGHPASHAAQKTLKIARLSVPSWLAGTDMYYRLNYRHDGRLAAYGQSDWVAPPATLLEPLIQRTIAAAGGWRAVIGPRNPAMATPTCKSASTISARPSPPRSAAPASSTPRRRWWTTTVTASSRSSISTSKSPPRARMRRAEPGRWGRPAANWRHGCSGGCRHRKARAIDGVSVLECRRSECFPDGVAAVKYMWHLNLASIQCTREWR